VRTDPRRTINGQTSILNFRTWPVVPSDTAKQSWNTEKLPRSMISSPRQRARMAPATFANGIGFTRAFCRWTHRPIFCKPLRTVNRVRGLNTKPKYGQRGKRTHNVDMVFCFLIYSIFAIIFVLLLYDLFGPTPRVKTVISFSCCYQCLSVVPFKGSALGLDDIDRPIVVSSVLHELYKTMPRGPTALCRWSVPDGIWRDVNHATKSYSRRIIRLVSRIIYCTGATPSKIIARGASTLPTSI